MTERERGPATARGQERREGQRKGPGGGGTLHLHLSVMRHHPAGLQDVTIERR